MAAKNAFYAQSGGVTAVINASAAGVIETARQQRGKIGKIYAGRNGIIGALTEDLIDTGKDSLAAIKALRHTPSGAFGSCRYKLKSLEQNRREYERLIEVFKAHNIGYFFYNGGGDSADTCLKVSQLSDTLGYPIQAIHVPKTVDNDLPITDCCPGFGSVAKYIAVSTLEASFDVASMSKTSTKVFVLEVMGRHAGWIAAAGGLASGKDCEIPVVILFPEIQFDKAKFLAKVDSYVKKFGFCSVVVSEGVKGEDGKFLSDQGVRDAFGHAQLGRPGRRSRARARRARRRHPARAGSAASRGSARSRPDRRRAPRRRRGCTPPPSTGTCTATRQVRAPPRTASAGPVREPRIPPRPRSGP